MALERLLQRVKRLRVMRNPLHGRDFVSVRLYGKHQAGAHGALIEQDRAGTADSVLTTEMRTREAYLMAKEIGKHHADADVLLVPDAVDRHGDRSRVLHYG